MLLIYKMKRSMWYIISQFTLSRAVKTHIIQTKNALLSSTSQSKHIQSGKPPPQQETNSSKNLNTNKKSK
jgi:hypothetical protein